MNAQETKGRCNVLDDFNRVEQDMGTILENGEFRIGVLPEEARIEILARDRIDME